MFLNRRLKSGIQEIRIAEDSSETLLVLMEYTPVVYWVHKLSKKIKIELLGFVDSSIVWIKFLISNNKSYMDYHVYSVLKSWYHKKLIIEWYECRATPLVVENFANYN